MVATVAALIVLTTTTLGDPPGRAADQAALKPFAGLVGTWKGTGQPKRGSTKGAWVESGDWAWSLTKDHAALAFTAPKGKYLRSGTLRPGEAAGTYVFDVTLTDGAKRSFSGKVGARETLVLAADGAIDSGLARISITPLHDTRFLLLLEGKEAGDFARLGEVGFTRQGVAFAAGDTAPVCIVTEGRGTIAVTHKGKTYYVCCSGCKDLFNDDPDGVLAEAERRKADAKK